ncbi:MAG: hypothetical protein P0S95_03915 [Rhabdochlamydiaceae bacterium]|nr:hypothetical protein [Candidatus Amphrikana amoebophyrae]
MRYFFLLFLGLSIHCYAFLDITKAGYEQYQDIWIKGRVAKKANYNHNYCEKRYQIIDKVLSRYNRPFTMLDIGAAQGYYSIRSAEKYPQSVFVMLEGNNKSYPKIGDQLRSICIDNELSNTVLLQHKIEIDQIGKLSACEHFDVILALNIFHWFGDNWELLANHILDMGYDIIIETPPIEKTLSVQNLKIRRDILKFLRKNQAILLGKVPRHTQEGLFSGIYHVRGLKNKLKMKTWLMESFPYEDHYIICDYNQKKLKKIDHRYNSHVRETEWLPGINILSFMSYYGSYPSSRHIIKGITDLQNVKTSDWMVNNMIVQGLHIEMIDLDDIYHEDKGGRKFSNKMLKKTIQFSKARGEKKVSSLFFNFLVQE